MMIEAVGAQALVAFDAEPALACDPAPVVNGLVLRKRLGRDRWAVPQEFGCCGWQVDTLNDGNRGRILVTADHQTDFANRRNWIHASISRLGVMPSYDDLKLMHAAVFGAGWAYQAFAPDSDHINIHAYVLHLFGRVDGERALPDFGRFGTI
jgi:hypothetical protein